MDINNTEIPVPDWAKPLETLPLGSLRVGQSFFVSGKLPRRERVRGRVERYMARNPGTKFAVGRTREGGEVGLRVWRTA